MFACLPPFQHYCYCKDTKQSGVLWLWVGGECKAVGGGTSSQKPTTIAINGLVNIKANFNLTELFEKHYAVNL
jgi:hypothetical protein